MSHRCLIDDKNVCGLSITHRCRQLFIDAIIGRFHTRRRTNRLDGQIVSDAQIVVCENGTNKFSDDFVV